MENKKIDLKEDFLRRLKESKRRKKLRIEEIVSEMKMRYEERTGMKAEFIEVW